MFFFTLKTLTETKSKLNSKSVTELMCLVCKFWHHISCICIIATMIQKVMICKKNDQIQIAAV